MTQLNLSRLHFPITALGPGSRVGIWFQGCSLHCPGCISADTWAKGRGRTTVHETIGAIATWLAHADGVTISGGEPFEQPRALLDLLTAIRGSFNGDILVYTGFELCDIDDVLASTAGLIDALISGPYRRNQPQSLPLRGSDNQTLHMLTDLGRARFGDVISSLAEDKPALDVMFDDDGSVWFAGIPRHNDFEKMRRILSAVGHDVAISADRSIEGDLNVGDDKALS